MESPSPPGNSAENPLPHPVQPALANVLPGYGAILRFSVPLMISLMTNALMSLIDTIFIGHLGTAQLAAVPMASWIYISGWVLFMGTLRNSIAFCGRAYGAGREREIGAILAHYQVLVFFGLPGMLAYIQAWPFFSAFSGLSAAVDGFGWAYLRIRVWDVVFSLTIILYSAF